MTRPICLRTCAPLLLAWGLFGCDINDEGLAGDPQIGSSVGPAAPPPSGEMPAVAPPIDPPPVQVVPPAPPLQPVAPPAPVPPQAPGAVDPPAAPPPPMTGVPTPPGSVPPVCDLDRPIRVLQHNASPSGDLAFDRQGFMVLGVGRDIARLAKGGDPMPFIENALPPGRTIYGLRMLSDGSVFFTDNRTDILFRYDARGMRRTFTMNAPIQLAQTPGGDFFVTGSQGQLFRLDPQTGRSSVEARMDGTLRGLVFSPDYKTLYVTERESRTLRSLRVQPDGALDAPRIWARGLGQEAAGLATDICGNVYVADQSGPLLRVTAAGRLETVTQVEGLSAIAFGSGRQGWDDRTLYGVSESRGGLYEIRIGVLGAPPLPIAAD
jgi:hypothetical protein